MLVHYFSINDSPRHRKNLLEFCKISPGNCLEFGSVEFLDMLSQNAVKMWHIGPGRTR